MIRERKKLSEKIKLIREAYGTRFCLEAHCQWRIGGRNACCLPRCLRGLKYKGRSDERGWKVEPPEI